MSKNTIKYIVGLHTGNEQYYIAPSKKRNVLFDINKVIRSINPYTVVVPYTCCYYWQPPKRRQANEKMLLGHSFPKTPWRKKSVVLPNFHPNFGYASARGDNQKLRTHLHTSTL